MLEVVTFTSQIHITADRHIAQCTSKFCWWNWKLLPEHILSDWPEYKDYYFALCPLRWQHQFKSGWWWGHSPVLIVLSQKMLYKKCMELGAVLVAALSCWKKDINSVIIRLVFKNSVKIGVPYLYEFIVSQKLNSVIVFALIAHHTPT
jgi:hypothetical protein